MDQHDLLFGVSSEVFARAAVTALGFLMAAAVRYLARIAGDIGSLKETVAVMGERSESHGDRLEKLETAVFEIGRTAG